MKFIAALRTITIVCALPHALPAPGAQQDHGSRADAVYPSRPVRLLIGLPAGGSADTLARVITPKLSEVFGQHVVIQNQPGAVSVIAADTASRATPDGHTLFLRTNFHAELGAWIRKESSYDMFKDFAPVSLAWRVPNVLVVSLRLPVSTVKDFVAYAKANSSLNYGSSGVESSAHLGMELLKKHTGIDMLHVSYKGTPQSIVDLLGGNIHAMFSNVPAVLSHIRNERIRALAVTSATRNPQLKNVPTMKEAGFPQLEFTVWVGVVAPAGVGRTILAQLNRALGETLRSKEVAAKIEANGAETAPMALERFAAFQKAEAVRWEPVLRDARAASK